MAWNQPGGNNQDPWGKKGPKKESEFDQLMNKINAMFGGKGDGKGSDKGGFGFFVIGFVILLILYVVKSGYTVDQKEKALVLTFGKHTRTDGPGLHFAFKPFQQVYKINVEAIQDVEVEGLMLTKDDNVATVKVKVQYKIGNPLHYKFNLTNPVETLQHATEAALRQVIGHTNLRDARTDGKELVRTGVATELKSILEPYESGLEIFRVNLIGNVDVPPTVKPAFDDAIKAEEDQTTSENQARAYRSQELPLAEGNAEKKIQNAQAYKAEVIQKAHGEVARFEKLLPEYEAAPQVTRDRLYIEAMESVLTKTSKVIIDTDGGNNMTYIPLDQIIKKNKKED